MEEYKRYCYQVSLQFGRRQRTIMWTFFWMLCLVNLSILGRNEWTIFNLRLHVRSWSDKILLEEDFSRFHNRKEFRIWREKFYPGPGFEPGPLAFRAKALTIWAIQDIYRTTIELISCSHTCIEPDIHKTCTALREFGFREIVLNVN